MIGFEPTSGTQCSRVTSFVPSVAYVIFIALSSALPPPVNETAFTSRSIRLTPPRIFASIPLKKSAALNRPSRALETSPPTGPSSRERPPMFMFGVITPPDEPPPNSSFGMLVGSMFANRCPLFAPANASVR